MSQSLVRSPTEEVADFFATGPTPEQIAAFHLSDAAIVRARELLEKNTAETITPEETDELDQIVLLDRIIMLIRSRLPHAGSQPT